MCNLDTVTIPRIPSLVVKYIAETFLKNVMVDDNGEVTSSTQDVGMLINLFKAFIWSENDDLNTLYYKGSVCQYISVLMYDALDHWYTLSDNTIPYILSPLDIAWVYEMTFLDHYSHSIDLEEFTDITDLLEVTSLYANETIMGFVGYHINIKFMKFITLLEKALMQNRGELLRFIYENAYSPIMAFYLYAKHNHVHYRTEENSLANDEGLLDLLISQENYKKELLSLAITGLFNNDHIYVEKYNKNKTLEKHMVMPNPAMVERLLCIFPDIRNELIPNYMKQKIKIDTENGDEWTEEESDELLPLDIWQQYKNTFDEYIFGCGQHKFINNNMHYSQMDDFYKDNAKNLYSGEKHVITVIKNEFIGKLLT